MASKQFRRSATNKRLGGVCGGLAAHLGVDANIVRVLAVVAAIFTSAPIVIAYAVMWMVVPEGDPDLPALDVDWQADGLRISWSGAVVPHSVTWAQWAGGVAGLGLVLAVLGGLAFGGAALAGIEVEALAPFVGMSTSLFWPAGVLLLFLGLLPRPYALTVTHNALWVERPLQKARRIDLADVDHIHRSKGGLTVHLKDGELLRLAPPPEDLALDAFEEQLRKSRRRALGHRDDLEDAEVERRQLQQILAARERS